SFLVCGVITACLAVLAWYCAERGWMPASRARRWTEVLAILVWLIQLLRCFYRMVAWNYRLTSRHLFLEWGFHTPAQGGIELTQIAQVLVQRNAAERWLGVGRLRILLTKGTKPLVLEGVRYPELIAVEIRGRVEKAREEQNEP